MKNLRYYIITFVLFALCSCKKQNEISILPIDKLYILEYNYTYPEKPEKYGRFHACGFCELDNGFNIKYVRRLLFCSDYFYNSTDIMPDSLRSKISKILLKYQTDTAFLYHNENRIYDGNIYRIIMQKENQKDIIIKFEPKFLPEDLKFVYSYLYENREKTEHRSKYDKLFEMFENKVKDDTFFLPKRLSSTIKFENVEKE